MARIESQAVAGYYATPDHLLVPIAGMIMFPDPDRQTEPAHFHVLDPCAGEGRALYGLTAAWFGPAWPALAKFRKSEHTRTGMCSPTHVHLTGIEMEEGRFKALDKAGRTLSEWSGLVLPVHGDALSVIWTGPGINLLYLNPPYEHDPVHGRMEHAFLLKFADTLTAGDGLLVFVVPFYALKASARLIAQKFEDVRCYRFGDEDFSAYKQVVLYARKRRFDLLEPDKDLERTILGWSKAVDGMPVLGAEQGLYQVRVHTQGLGKVSLMPLNVNSCLDRWKPQTVGPTGYDQTADQMTMRVFPLGMRPREAHIAAAMGAGVFNGVRISANDGKGPDLLLKAVFTKDWLKTEEKKDKNGNVTAVVEQQQPKLNVVILRMDTSEFVILKNTDTPTGNSKIEDWSVADLLLNYGRSLVTAMDRTCPALHDPRRPREEIPLPPTVRTPFQAQREAIQAALKIAFTGESPYGLGEIGSGKTTLATVLLWALSTAHFEATRRAVLLAERERRVNLGALAGAFPRVQKSAVRPVRAALVLCPPHLLKSWQDQIQSVIPGASVIVLNEPADLERVRESKDRPVLPMAKSKTPGKGKTLSLFEVQTDRGQVPAGPVPGQGLTIALLTRETAKLGHGYDHGYAHTRGGVHVACPSCGTLSESKVTLDAVKRRVRCEGRTARPNNGVALLMSEIAHGAASVVKGSTASAILGVSRFGRRLKNKRMPTVGQFFRLYAWAWAEHTRLFKAERKAQSVVFALFDLAMVVPMTPDESERAAVLIMIMAKSFFGDSSYNHGAELNLAKDLYLCRAAPFQSEADHARAWAMFDGGYSHGYGRSNFLSMASVVRNAHLKIEALSPSGNAHGGNGFDARIKVTSAGEVLYEGRTIGAVDWIGKFLDDAHPASAWDVRGCYEFLYQAAGVRRFPLATLISQKHKDLFDFVIGDEFHEYNNDGTAQERAFHRLTALSATTMGLSGSLMAGYAKQLFRNLWAMSPRFRFEYKYTDMTWFCRQFGYYKRLIQVDDKKG
jgi:hypothetical protein